MKKEELLYMAEVIRGQLDGISENLYCDPQKAVIFLGGAAGVLAVLQDALEKMEDDDV